MAEYINFLKTILPFEEFDTSSSQVAKAELKNKNGLDDTLVKQFYDLNILDFDTGKQEISFYYSEFREHFKFDFYFSYKHFFIKNGNTLPEVSFFIYNGDLTTNCDRNLYNQLKQHFNLKNTILDLSDFKEVDKYFFTNNEGQTLTLTDDGFDFIDQSHFNNFSYLFDDINKDRDEIKHIFKRELISIGTKNNIELISDLCGNIQTLGVNFSKSFLLYLNNFKFNEFYTSFTEHKAHYLASLQEQTTAISKEIVLFPLIALIVLVFRSNIDSNVYISVVFIIIYIVFSILNYRLISHQGSIILNMENNIKHDEDLLKNKGILDRFKRDIDFIKEKIKSIKTTIFISKISIFLLILIIISLLFGGVLFEVIVVEVIVESVVDLLSKTTHIIGVHIDCF